MILYFADRQMRVLGHASTNLPKGYVISEDVKTEDVETGVATFSCYVGFTDATRATLEEMTNAGNYLLRSNGGENEFYTIIDTEIDTKNKEIYIYAEDAGLDLLNEIADEFEAAESHNAEWYINKYIIDSGFEIGINEIPADSVRKLKWEGEETVTARLASIATQFGGYEISFSFDIKGLEITHKYINIQKERGQDTGVQLRLNRDIDRIVTSKSVANLATAFVCEGGVPDDAEEPITLKGYKYDDGDFYVDDNGKLKSRKAVEKWSRYVWNKEPNQLSGYEGHIVRPYSYNTTDQKTLCSHAITELKKVCDMEINYEIDINRLPEGVKIGDRVNIIDDAGEMYISTRVLKLEASVVNQKYEATLGEHLIKTSGISQKVAALAEEFAKTSQSAARALEVASSVHAIATTAQEQAAKAVQNVQAATKAAEDATAAANTATESAATAEAKALAAQAAVDKVEKSVSAMVATVEEAKAAAANAHKAAEDATAKADEAKTAASNADTKADKAKTSAEEANSAAKEAKIVSAGAVASADIAKTNAKEAIDTANAAKVDAEQAERDLAAFGESLETVTNTMHTDYARKTELTETTAHLQSQISRNSAGLSSTVTMLKTVDETANDAREKANAAEIAADDAQEKANAAKTAADQAQSEANTAKAAAESAQTEAETARAAADAARLIADNAQADLEAARIELATISARADATAEEIEAAQAAVNAAQSASNIAQANVATALQTATTAQERASDAVLEATNAQMVADAAKVDADNAQALADKFYSDWESANAEADTAETLAGLAKSTAEEAQAIAEGAQATANTAANTANEAQLLADEARANAEAAQKTAETAASTAAQAQINLDNAKARLAEVLADAEATEADIAAAQTDVETAQAAANQAEASATAAQTAAKNAQANAEVAQAEATEALTEAQTAQAAADEAKAAAEEAQAAVDGLAVRVTKTESKITQTAKDLTLRVTETEDETTTNSERITNAESILQLLSNAISMLVTDEHGTTLLEQTSEGWSFNMKSIQDNVESASEQLGALTEGLGSTQAAVDVLNSAVADLGELAAYVRIGEYTYTDESGNQQTEPSIDLGGGGTGFKLKITNTRILFTDGSTELVSINSKDKSLDIGTAKIKRELQIENETVETNGVWVWKQRSNGNLGLMWKEVNS